MKAEKISEVTTNRLSVYLRCLSELAAEGERTVSSGTLEKRFNLNSAQIRKDLANFGEFGVRGVGYYVESLRGQLAGILGLDKEHRVCIIGAGRLGTALADYQGFKMSNFEVVALFDADKTKIGKKVGKVKIFDIKNFAGVVKRDNIKVAIIAVPGESAQKVLEQVTAAGIKAVLNFAPVPLRVLDGVKLNTIDLTTSLESLSCFLAGSNGKNLKPISKNGRK